MRPARELTGTFPEHGWHSDYPYHPGVLERERWQDDSVLGVQFNICVDEFRTDNAATQYLPDSSALRQWPTVAFNTGGTHMGKGVHRDVKQMTAPGGSALIYDSRTWHRACEELNASGEDRVAILNAVTPAWVLPMTDKQPATDRYNDSPTADMLTERERQDIDRLCNTATQAAPPGAPRIKRPERRPG
jgi:ectoine hydroxylase-related dioxygenase (phytanoyl-CoA dioxygenase family)